MKSVQSFTIAVSTERKWETTRFLVPDKGDFCKCEYIECYCGKPEQTYTDLGIDKIYQKPSMHDLLSLYMPVFESLPKYYWDEKPNRKEIK